MAPKKLSADQRKDLLRRYRQRTEHSAKWRSKEGVNETWSKLIDMYRGRHFESQLLSEEDKIAVNIVFATINEIAPSVAINYPKLCVYARKSTEEGQAQIVETVVNYWWRHYKFLGETNLAVRDWLIIGHGWLKVGWRYVEEQAALNQQELAEAADVAKGTDGGTVGPQDKQTPIVNEEDSESTSGEPEVQVAEDRPFVERVSPFDMFVDPEAKTLNSAKWIAQRIVKPLEEVRQDKRYKQKGRAALKSDSTLNPDWLADGSEVHDDVRRVTIWEFYDLQMGTFSVFPQHGADFLVDPCPQPYAFGHPFVMLRNYEIPDEFYPMGDVEALEPLQMELDKTRSMMMNHRKKYSRKFLYNPEAFDQVGTSLLKDDRDNIMVPVQPDVPLQEAVIPLQQIPVEPQLFQYSQDVVAEMDRVSGVTDFQSGAMPEIRRSATEASMIQDAANARSADKIAQVELMLAAVAERVVQLAQQFLTEDQEARIVGKNGHPLWIPFGRQQIQGQYDFEVEAGSTQPHNESFRKQQALQLLQAMTPWAQMGLVNAQELVRYALQYGFQVKNPDDFIAAPQPQPQQGEQKANPRDSLVESLNYKDAPPDIQRQIEAAAGFQPSQMGGSSPVEGLMAKQQGAATSAQAQQQQAQLQQEAQLAQIAAQAQDAHAKRGHDHHMAMTKAAIDMQAQEREHQLAQEQAEQAAQHQIVQQALAGPQEGAEGGQGTTSA